MLGAAAHDPAPSVSIEGAMPTASRGGRAGDDWRHRGLVDAALG
jgi:hypothetical protein